MAAENGRSATCLCVQRKPSTATATATADAMMVALGVAKDDTLERRVREGERKGLAFLGWSVSEAAGAAWRHPVPCAFALSLLLFMDVEYTIPMVASSSPPVDFGFIATAPFHRVLEASPALNNVLAALNPVFVGMQTFYILWTFLVEGRLRPGTAALFMFTCRGILGCSTQLPLPHEHDTFIIIVRCIERIVTVCFRDCWPVSYVGNEWKYVIRLCALSFSCGSTCCSTPKY